MFFVVVDEHVINVRTTSDGVVMRWSGWRRRTNADDVGYTRATARSGWVAGAVVIVTGREVGQAHRRASFV